MGPGRAEDLPERRGHAGQTLGQLCLIVHVSVPNVDYLHGFLMDKFTARREVVGFRTSVIYQHTHNQVLEPLTP
ncbi:hypothetical protein [Streptomyces canus]|uniref:hypothetical protein n=1 Tax=Streptomyces canus TaxID=58343 RepID=UPI002E29E0A7|nr:hypothetical protein [Streptomyces canus]